MLEMVDIQVFGRQLDWEVYVEGYFSCTPQRLASHNGTIVGELWRGEGRGGNGSCEVHIRRPFQDWKPKEVTRFVDQVSVKVQEGENTLFLEIDERTLFSIKFFYNSLSDDIFYYS